MATLIGVVRQVVGEAFAVASDGTRRPLVEGDRVYAGEQLVTSAMGSIAVALAGGGELTLGRDSHQQLSTQLLAEAHNDPSAQSAAATTPTAPSQQDLTDVQQLQAAIEAGVDPTQTGEATAAGPGGGGAGGAGGGHSFVLLGETGGAVDPTIGFPTGPISSVPEFPTAEPATDTPQIAAVVVPDSTPEVEVEYQDFAGQIVVGPGVVDEEALADGSNPSSNAEQASGRLIINSPDGISALEILDVNGSWINVTNGGVVQGQYGFLTFDAAGNWIYTLADNTLDHTNPNASGSADQVGESFSVRMFDLDGDVSPTVQLNVLVNDDNPDISLGQGEFSALVVDETGLGLSGTGNFAGAFQANFGADGGVVAYALEINSIDSGLRDVATGAVIELHLVGGTIQGWVGGNPAVVAFTAAVDDSGDLTLTQLRALQHPDINDNDEPLAIAGGVIRLVAIATDGDGDTASANLDLGGLLVFRDDGPSASLQLVSQAASVVHDETSGVQVDTDSAAELPAAFAALGAAIGWSQGSASVVSTAGSSFGADAAGATQVISLVIRGGNGVASGLQTTAGANINLYLQDGLVVGRVGAPDGAVAFAVSIDPDSGVLSVAQYLSLHHPDSPTNYDESMSFVSFFGESETISSLVGAVLTVTDADGDVAVSDVVDIGQLIQFQDD
ncbi:MAG: retention module-containing protein, partial [Pseudomonas sp.]|nr:retention module-containing protein [Pseudomonas sp.]